MRKVQNHHITYKPERKVKVYAGEHKILSLIQWYERKTVSAGFIVALEDFIKKRGEGAVEL